MRCLKVPAWITTTILPSLHLPDIKSQHHIIRDWAPSYTFRRPMFALLAVQHHPNSSSCPKTSLKKETKVCDLRELCTIIVG